jgi:formate hydrogenlyase subunit 3/multisubunit Na+/H+ antiporter MnhD subunit
MDKNTKSSLIAAAIIVVGFCILAYFLPSLVLWLGEKSPYAGAAAAAVFVLAFFGIFWLRGRSRGGDRD